MKWQRFRLQSKLVATEINSLSSFLVKWPNTTYGYALGIYIVQKVLLTANGSED